MSAPAATDAPRHRGLALLWAALCHLAFVAGAGSMVVGIWFGLTLGQGALPWPWAGLANLVLLVQFPLAHSALLTGPGRRWLARLAPAPYGTTLAPTTYAAIASLQLLALFALWTPSGVVLWRPEGAALMVMGVLYAAAWGLLAKASLDAGWQLQAGVTGWWALYRGRPPRYPDMPERGLFRLVRQPIYVSFALALWPVGVWTPDQLLLATAWTGYCLAAPRLKERRFARIHGTRWQAYRARVPYWLPWPRPGTARPGPAGGPDTERTLDA